MLQDESRSLRDEVNNVEVHGSRTAGAVTGGEVDAWPPAINVVVQHGGDQGIINAHDNKSRDAGRK